VSVLLTWIGQAGFLLRTPATRLAVDPFLSDHPGRRFPAPVGVGDLAGTELVLASHEHLDHLDAPALAGLLARDDRARVVVPAPVVPVAAAAGLPPDRLVGAVPGRPLTAATPCAGPASPSCSPAWRSTWPCCPSTAATPSGRPATSSATWTAPRPSAWPATPASPRWCRCTTT
jgi:Beta-lactamase superfamily domain